LHVVLRLVAPMITPEVRPSASHGLWKTNAFSASWRLRQHFSVRFSTFQQFFCSPYFATKHHIVINTLRIGRIARDMRPPGHWAEFPKAWAAWVVVPCKPPMPTDAPSVSTKDTKCKDMQSATQRNISHRWNLLRDVQILRAAISAHVKCDYTILYVLRYVVLSYWIRFGTFFVSQPNNAKTAMGRKLFR